MEQTDPNPNRPETDWGDPPARLVLSRDDVHIWRVSLNPPPDMLEHFAQIIANDERARAERFRFGRDRRRFIAAHGQLRIILARYLELEPSSVQFSYGKNGKPSLSEPPGIGLKFNLTHSGELGLVAVTEGREIGIDVEETRPLDDADRIAERFFSRRENEALRSLDETERLEAFYRCWTCKEAYLKAAGEGLTRSTASFDVAFCGVNSPRLLAVDGQESETDRWSLISLVPRPGYIGAVAIEGQGCLLKCWRQEVKGKGGKGKR